MALFSRKNLSPANYDIKTLIKENADILCFGNHLKSDKCVYYYSFKKSDFYWVAAGVNKQSKELVTWGNFEVRYSDSSYSISNFLNIEYCFLLNGVSKRSIKNIITQLINKSANENTPFSDLEHSMLNNGYFDCIPINLKL